MKILLKNARIFDGKQSNLSTNQNILIENNRIAKITKNQSGETVDQVIDLEGKVIIPGLIDAHVHVTANQVNLYQEDVHPASIYASSFNFMKEMLMRGFTTIRDAGGADAGIKNVVEEGLVTAPRIYMSGKALSQTAGHGDFRRQTDSMEPCACSVQSGSSISIICDGVSAVRKAAREQLRQGASQIKIMASGGIASPTDKVTNIQFSDEEISAIVEEAQHFGAYVMAHAYTPEAMQRCIKLGVHSLEHGNLLNEETALLMQKHKTYLVPTLSIYEALYQHGKEANTPKFVLDKLQNIREQGLKAIHIARKSNVSIGFGTDLLGDLQEFQSNEFALRSKVETPFETLQSATSVNAEMMGLGKQIGVIAENYLADLLVVDGNPLEDISLLGSGGNRILIVIKNGEIIKNTVENKNA